jgi:hypothetical protein
LTAFACDWNGSALSLFFLSIRESEEIFVHCRSHCLLPTWTKLAQGYLYFLLCVFVACQRIDRHSEQQPSSKRSMSASPPAAAALNVEPAGSPPPAAGPSSAASRMQQTLLVGGVVASKAILAPFHCKYENVLIPMRDGVRLAGDLYRPAMNGVPDECQ